MPLQAAMQRRPHRGMHLIWPQQPAGTTSHALRELAATLWTEGIVHSCWIEGTAHSLR